MAVITPARPGVAVPGLTVPGLDFSASLAAAKSTSTVTDPRDGTATVT